MWLHRDDHRPRALVFRSPYLHRQASVTFRLWLASLLLLGQMLGTGSQMARAALSPDLLKLLAAQGVLCHAEGGPRDTNPSGPAAPSPDQHDCALCVARCQDTTSYLAPAEDTFLPEPRLTEVARHGDVPPATGPPPQIRQTARPRAPPPSIV